MNQIKFWMTILLLVVPVCASRHANAGTAQDVSPVVIELFYRGDSDQSLNALKYARELQSGRQGVEVKSYDVLNDQGQLKRLWQLSKRFGLEKAKVPSFYLADRLVIGFPDATSGSRVEDLLTINAYIRPGCKHCIAGKQFLDELVQRRPALRVKYHDVVADLAARNEVQSLAARYKVQIPSFPCIEAAGRLVVGFQTAETTGARVEAFYQDRSVASAAADGAEQQPSTDKTGDEQAWQPRSQRNADGAVTAWSAYMACGVSNSVWTALIWLDEQDSLDSVASRNKQGAPPQERPQSTDDAAVPEDVPLPEDAPLPADVPLPDEAPLPDDVELPGDDGVIKPLPSEVLRDSSRDEIDVPWLGRLSVSELGLPAFTFLIGLVDGFNPCAMWVLIFLLSVLVNIKDRKKILIVAGTFVVVSGLAYFVFMAAWFNVFQLIGLLRPVQIGLGIIAILVGAINIKDFFAFHKGISLSIPESAKPGIYRRVRQVVSANNLATALGAAIVLAVVVNIVELLCTAGLPALYTGILTMQGLPTWENYAYLGLYIVAYMLDDTILVLIVVATLSHRRLQESEGRWLKLLSGIVILALGIVMIFWPDALI